MSLENAIARLRLMTRGPFDNPSWRIAIEAILDEEIGIDFRKV